MNWFSISPRAVLAAIVAAGLGFVLYGVLARHGLEAPWIVALLAGPTAAAFSRGKNVIRGLVVGTVGVWTAALAQAFYLPIAPGDSVLSGLVHFHEALSWSRLFAFVVCAVAAIVSAAWSPFATPPLPSRVG